MAYRIISRRRFIDSSITPVLAVDLGLEAECFRELASAVSSDVEAWSRSLSGIRK